MNSKEKAAKMEKHLLKTQFPLECEELPYDELSSEEQEVVTKCINHDDLSDEEFSLLKKTLVRYRKAINKHKPTQSVEAFEKTKQMVLTEKDWLDIVDNKQNRMLKVNVPYNGNWYSMEFEILPLDDSRVVSTLTTHIDLFKDYSKQQMNVWRKAHQGEVLTPEEAQIVKKMNEEIEAKNSEDRITSMNKFLAAQLRLPNSTSDLETRIEFWQKFPFITKAAIMEKAEQRLGLDEQSNQKLFPSG